MQDISCHWQPVVYTCHRYQLAAVSQAIRMPRSHAVCYTSTAHADQSAEEQGWLEHHLLLTDQMP